MLTSMRKPVAKVVTLGLFGLLILSFAVWGIGDIFRGPGRSTAVAEVGDVKIDQREFSRRLTREMNRLGSAIGSRIDIQEAQSLGIVDQVLNQMINRALFDQQAQDMRLIVSEDQVKTAILEEPAFQNQLGEFERSRFVQVLRASNMGEVEYIAALGNDIKRQQIIDAVTAAPVVSKTLAEAMYRYADERRIAELVVVPNGSVPEPADPDEAALAAFYSDIASEFMSPETKSLTLIQLRAEDFIGEVSVAEDDIREEFEARRPSLVTPERRSLEQIVFDDEAAAREAKTALDQGSDFAAIARIEGGEPIDLGTYDRDELARQLPEVADAAFALADRGVSEPVQTDFGWHLVRVKAIEPGAEPVFEDLREQLRRELAMRVAVDGIISIANQLDDEIGGGANLEEAGARLDLKILTLPAVDARGLDAEGKPIEGLPPPNELMAVVQELQPGEESLLTETREGDYFIVRVDGVAPAARRPLDDVREDVIARWKSNQRNTLAREKAEALMARAREGVELAALAEQDDLTFSVTGPFTRNGAGLAPPATQAMAGDVFGLKKGELVTVRGGDGFLVAKLIDVQQVDPAANPAAVEALQEQLAASVESDLLAEFSGSLRKQFSINVNTVLLDEVLNGY